MEATATIPHLSNSSETDAQDASGTTGRSRVVIEGITPQVDGGRFPIKRVVGESVVVEADIFNDGHDLPAAVVCYRRQGEAQWQQIPMEPLVNDRWRAQFTVQEVGRYVYTIQAWVDHFSTWRHDLRKRVRANQDVTVDLLIGAEMVQDAASGVHGNDQHRLGNWVQRLRSPEAQAHLEQICDDPELDRLMQRHAPRRHATVYPQELGVVVDRERARFSSWYEMFPRSAADQHGRHGTLQDVIKRLPYVASMGFDVLYLPPIHPVGRTNRKGRNNSPACQPGDVGSPWGIGAEEGGHKAIHPELGTFEDFDQLVKAARQHGMEIALDIAFQCSPDHPYVKEHPQWFRRRPDGTIQYAENPPKKYEDIYPFDFETDDWEALWHELKSVFVFWIERGVRIFRVDNPHTKPFPFWQWCIGELKEQWPDVLFLSEAFTRPKIMYRLAKLGFSQSYTYFTWRNTKEELTEYLEDLTGTGVGEFFRPNFWPNTPDILTEYLQVGGRPAFMARLVLAATLTSNYGIYGPPFEHVWTTPRETGSEEYFHSEKYEIHYHDIDRQDSLRSFIGRINKIRRDHRALQSMQGLLFHPVDNDKLLCYSKHTEDLSELLVMVVSLDPHHRQAGWVTLPLQRFGLREEHPYQVHDLVTDERFLWQGKRNYVEIDPHIVPAHVFRVRRRVRTERDFEYYL